MLQLLIALAKFQIFERMAFLFLTDRSEMSSLTATKLVIAPLRSRYGEMEASSRKSDPSFRLLQNLPRHSPPDVIVRQEVHTPRLTCPRI